MNVANIWLCRKRDRNGKCGPGWSDRNVVLSNGCTRSRFDSHESISFRYHEIKLNWHYWSCTCEILSAFSSDSIATFFKMSQSSFLFLMRWDSSVCFDPIHTVRLGCAKDFSRFFCIGLLTNDRDIAKSKCGHRLSSRLRSWLSKRRSQFRRGVTLKCDTAFC